MYQEEVMATNINGKIIVITGASSGLGEAAARHLAGLGAKVVLGARRAERLESLVEEIAAAGGDAIAVPRTSPIARRSQIW